MQHIIDNIISTYNLKRRGNRWAGPCPKCGGSATSDKFSIRDDGGFKCYGCNFKGDIITWLREMEGKSCPDAFEAAGLSCDRHGCAVRSTCRLGDGQPQQRRTRQAQTVAPPRADQDRTIGVADRRDPCETWRLWAVNFFDDCFRNLRRQPGQITWLQQRGIPERGLNTNPLGWHPRSTKINRASIGLPPERDGKTSLWVPAGLVIPTFVDDQLHRIRIRRTEADRQRFNPDLKYVWIEGSGTAPMLIGNLDQPRGIVIVEAELDAIACSSTHPDVAVVAIGTVQGNITTQIRELCQSAPVILVALDADADSAAGQTAVKTWLSTWPQARYWPVPSGKDPGDYVTGGGNLHQWIDAGLPPRPAGPVVATPDHAEESIRLSETDGGKGAENQVDSNQLSDGSHCKLQTDNYQLPPHSQGVSAVGTPFVIAGHRRDVDELHRDYRVATFYPAELSRLKGMDKPSAELVLKAKGIFDNAEVLGVREVRR